MKTPGDFAVCCDANHMLHLVHKVKDDVFGWDVLISPSDEVNDVIEIKFCVLICKLSLNIILVLLYCVDAI